MKLVLLGFAGSTQPTTSQDIASDAVGAASAAIKIRNATYIAPEGAPTEAGPLRVKNPSMRIYTPSM